MPVRELREISDDAVGVGPKIMRSIAMQQNARLVMKIAGISPDVVAALDHETGFAKLGTKTFGQHCARKTGTYNQIVKFQGLEASTSLAFTEI